jgi:two-component system phosphate regulon response regulator PhoB
MKKKSRSAGSSSGQVLAVKQPDPQGVDIDTVDAASLAKALELLRAKPPDVIYLELVLSGKDGRDLVEHLEHDFELKKIRTFQVPIAEGAPVHSPEAFNPDADESSAHRAGGLSFARLRVVPRKKSGHPLVHDGAVRIRDLVIHPGRREVYVGMKKIRLTFTHFNILWYLARKPGWVFTYDQIIDAARGPDANIQESSLKTHIFDLRKRLGHAGRYIETVPGVGYRLRDDLV